MQELFPGTQVTIGPVIENGFYYDFFRNEPFTTEDFAAIEKKMREIIQRDKPFTKSVKTREEAKDFFREKGELFKVELVDAIPGRPGHQVLRPGRLDRPVPRPAHDVHRQDRQRLQADEGGRRLLARRFEEPDADAHLRHRLGQREGPQGLSHTRSKKPRSATTASSAARWTCSTSRRKGPASCSGTPRAGPCSSS